MVVFLEERGLETVVTDEEVARTHISEHFRKP